MVDYLIIRFMFNNNLMEKLSTDTMKNIVGSR